MWPPNSVSITIREVDAGDVAMVAINTPAGQIEILGLLEWQGNTLYIREAHIDGPGKGAMRRGGLNAIGAQILIEAGVHAVVIEGAKRTTGAGPHRNRVPPPFRYPR